MDALGKKSFKWLDIVYDERSFVYLIINNKIEILALNFTLMEYFNKCYYIHLNKFVFKFSQFYLHINFSTEHLASDLTNLRGERNSKVKLVFRIFPNNNSHICTWEIELTA